MVKVHGESIVVLPKSIRDTLGITEGVLLKVRIGAGKLFLKLLELRQRIWSCVKGLGSVEETELEIDREE